MAKVFDFEAFQAEHESVPLVVKGLFGEDWELPGVGQLRAKDVMRVQQLTMEMAELAEEHGLDDLDDDADLPSDLVPKMMHFYDVQREVYLGKENVEAWMDKGITDDALKALLEWAQAEHNDVPDAEGDDEGNAETPTEA